MAYFDQAFGTGASGGGLTLQSLLDSLKTGRSTAGGPLLPDTGKSGTNATPTMFPATTAAGTQPAQYGGMAGGLPAGGLADLLKRLGLGGIGGGTVGNAGLPGLTYGNGGYTGGYFPGSGGF